MKKKIRRKMFLVTLIYILIGIVLLNNVTSTTYQIIKKQKEKKEFQNTLVELKEKQEELNATVAKLQDPDYVARYAREKYLYSKNGEIIIRIPE